MDRRNSTDRGFTLIEIVVILGVIAILVAILTPAVLKYLDDARNRRAEADVKQIAGALLQLMKDTGEYPGDKSNAACLVSDGDDLLGCNTLLASHLIKNNTGYSSSGHFKWNGPYINELKPDPWGNAYIVRPAIQLKGNNTNPVWVISAGTNGFFDTTTNATTLSDDDIGVRIK